MARAVRTYERLRSSAPLRTAMRISLTEMGEFPAAEWRWLEDIHRIEVEEAGER